MGSMGAKNCFARSVGLANVYPSSFCGCSIGRDGSLGAQDGCTFVCCCCVVAKVPVSCGSCGGVNWACVAVSVVLGGGVVVVCSPLPNRFCAKLMIVGFVIIWKIAPVLSSLVAVGDESFATPSKIPLVSSFKKGTMSCNLGDDCVFLLIICQAKNSSATVDQFKFCSFL